MAGPSKHLSWDELACSDGTPYPTRWRKNRAAVLARAFEAIRHECGDKPIKVTSGYRSPEANKQAGGAKSSQHLAGRALDLKPPKGLTNKEFFCIIKGLAKDTHPEIKGIGCYPAHVHVDVRNAPQLVVWEGSYGN